MSEARFQSVMLTLYARLREEGHRHGWDICNLYNAETLRRVVRIANTNGESVQPFRKSCNRMC